MIAEAKETFDLTLRLLLAAVLGGMLGQERQKHGKVAGLRTHMLVSLATATFVVATIAMGGTNQKEDVARVVQGAAAGIGFIGAGTILKHSEADQVIGLTTAASVWMAAAIGVAAGTGSVVVAMISTFVSWFILEVLARYERHPSEHQQQ